MQKPNHNAGNNVILLGAFDFSYPREKVLFDALGHLGAAVRLCTYADAVMFPGMRKVALLPSIHIRLILEFARHIIAGHRPDVILVTRFNPLLLPLAFVLSRCFGATLVYDLFVSIHRTAAMRGYASPLVWSMYILERFTYRLPDKILVGTDQFIKLYSQIYGLPLDRFIRVPPAADEERFYDRGVPKRSRFTALYWGNFLPHHGVDVIIEAAALLDKQAPIDFVLLGAGPQQRIARESAAHKDLSNVQFEGSVTDEVLHDWIARSHVCLGVFSEDVRALASITNKVCEAAASRKAIVTENSPAIRECFAHGENIHTVEPGSSEMLATALVNLYEQPEYLEILEDGSLLVHERQFSVGVIAEILRKRINLI